MAELEMALTAFLPNSSMNDILAQNAVFATITNKGIDFDLVEKGYSYDAETGIISARDPVGKMFDGDILNIVPIK